MARLHNTPEPLPLGGEASAESMDGRMKALLAIQDHAASNYPAKSVVVPIEASGPQSRAAVLLV